jgi:hypothetical protein
MDKRSFRKWLCQAAGPLLVMALAGGCETAAQRQVVHMRANADGAMQAFRMCGQSAYEQRPEILRKHVPLNVADATLAQLSDRSIATDDEVQALLAHYPPIQSCRKTFLDQLARSHPSIAAILASGYTRADGSLVELIQKKKTWGSHVQTLKEESASASKEIVAENQRIAAGLSQSHQAELAQRQAAANAFSQYLQTQQLIQSMNRPVVTNCTRFGSATNCISQ